MDKLPSCSSIALPVNLKVTQTRFPRRMSQPAFTIASLIRDPGLDAACGQWLQEGRYDVVPLGLAPDPFARLAQSWETFDAVLLEQGALPEALDSLRHQGLLLPAVVVGPVSGQLDYHDAEVHLPADQLEQLSYSLDAAISRFLRRGNVDGSQPNEPGSDGSWRLSSRLQERLGYLGVFYKRDPSRFLRNLPPMEQKELFLSLERTYRDLLVSYFKDEAAANQALESFVNTAFFSDLSITKTVAIHANLIDEFWKLLKLKGQKDDFLRDYRLALLDVMSHLCEMYRRSLPVTEPAGGPRAIASASLQDLQTNHPSEVHP